MRVLIIDLLCNTPAYDAGLVRALCAAGAKAELASPSFYAEPDILDLTPRSPWLIDLTIHFSKPRLLRLATRSIELGLNFTRLRRAVARGAYDVIHLEWIPLEDRQTRLMRLLHAACARAGVPLVFTAHNAIPHDTEGVSRDMIRRNLEQADLIIVHSDNVARSLRDEVGVDTMLQPIPHPAFHADLVLPSRESAAAALSLDDGPVVLFAGIVRPYKGIDLLAEAWPLVREAFPTATLLVAGRALGEEAQGQLQRLAALPGVRVAAKYVPMKTMIDYHVASDVVVFPYRAISQSGALMTALGLGRPAVVTPIPGLAEQAVGIPSVLVASSADGRGVAEATIAALRDSEALDMKAAEERRRLAESPLGWPSVARRTIEAYEQALTAMSRPSRDRGSAPTTP